MQTNTAEDAIRANDDPTEDAIRAALTAICSPGSFFDAAERKAFAEHARAARGLTDHSQDLPPLLVDTVARVAAKAMSTRRDHVRAWERDGRDVLAYIELVSVVAQIAGIDSYRLALGVELDKLPEPASGEPTPVIHPDARVMNAWVPTVGIALAPTAVSALPDEKATKQKLASAWYLPDDVIHRYDVEPGREITRPQMELVAARTSWLNECFF